MDASCMLWHKTCLQNTASGPAFAPPCWEQNLPNLIVMDVMMAEMDGLTALKQLKSTDQTKGIPVIMITASAHHVTRQEAETSGAALFLTKPFSPTQLLMAVRNLVPGAERV